MAMQISDKMNSKIFRIKDNFKGHYYFLNQILLNIYNNQ